MRKITHIIFNRITIIGLAILAQVLWVTLLLYHFSLQFTTVNWLMRALAILVVFGLTNKWNNPSYKLSWACLILILPIFGLVLYYSFGRSGLTKHMAGELERVAIEVEEHLRTNSEKLELLEKEDESVAVQAKYILQHGRAPLYQNTKTKYYPSGEEMYPDMLEAIRGAKYYIFVEYFILARGKMLDEVLDLLEKKAAEGVDVRVMYDDVGCVTTLPRNFDVELEERGIACVAFNRLRPIVSVFLNNRDHRKFLLVDGIVGFTGGINLADEYINEIERFGYWKDTGIRLTGEAVWSMTAMFLELWSYVKKSSEDYKKFYTIGKDARLIEAKGFVQPYTDSPLTDECVGKNIYMNIINRAKKYVYIFTPYLIIDNEMIVALSNAAKSGIDVRIVMPGVPDKKLVYIMSQSYYAQLIDQGVRIYQFKPGFLHAKVFLCDDEIATVGSINLDYRSLYLHFENGVWMYRTDAIGQIKQDMAETMKQSEEITAEFCKSRPVLVRAVQSVCRLVAPLF